MVNSSNGYAESFNLGDTLAAMFAHMRLGAYSCGDEGWNIHSECHAAVLTPST